MRDHYIPYHLGDGSTFPNLGNGHVIFTTAGYSATVPEEATVADIFRAYDMIPPNRSPEAVRAWLARP